MNIDQELLERERKSFGDSVSKMELLESVFKTSKMYNFIVEGTLDSYTAKSSVLEEETSL